MDGSIDKKAESTPWKKTLGLFSSDVKKGGSLKASAALFFSRWKNEEIGDEASARKYYDMMKKYA